MQRLRLTFSKTAAMRYTGHLDLHATWERTMRRAGLPLAYSQGFHPQPKIQLASALPLGFTSECEMGDVWLETAHDLAEARARLERAAPPGIVIHALAEVPEGTPKLQVALRAAEYQALIASTLSAEELDARIAALLAQTEIPRVRREKKYDLRPLIETLARAASDDLGHTLVMRLAAREGATGRPEEVVEALGHSAAEARFHRQRLFLSTDGTD
jgi:radical SAM-linked protein